MSATITQSTRSATQIAEDAFIYGFPLIMNYGIMYEYAVNPNSGQYKAPFNQISNEANVFTPKDTTVISPNSDTPYSMLWMDLRAEPVVLSVPEVETGRYYTVQIVDLYTHNYAYVGSRATGNGAGSFIVAGPGWSGPTPPGIKKVFQCETLFSAAAFRTQLFGPADIDNVRKVQAGYKVQTLSQFRGQPAPPASPPIDFPPITKDLAKADPFAFVNFMLSLCPSSAVETALRAEFATIGVEAGKPFNFAKLAPGLAGEVVQGIKSGMAKIEQKSVTLGTSVNGWRTGLNSGSRAYYKADWLLRAGVALAGIYANDAAEALYPVTHTDSTAGPLDGSTGKSTLDLPGRATAPGERVLVAHDVRRQDATAGRQPDQSLPAQLADASGLCEECRRIADALHPEGFTRRGQGGELAAGTERRLLHAAAAVLAEAGRARWPMEGPRASRKRVRQRVPNGR